MNIIFVLLAVQLFRAMRFRWYYMCTVVVFDMQYPFTISTLLSQPMNTVSVARTRVKMECSRNPHVYPVNWEFASPSSNSFSYIYISESITENLNSRYKIDTDNRTRYDIVIDSVDLSHAGTYICTPITEEVVNTPSNSAELIVLASNPVCKTNASALNDSMVEGDYLTMCCTVNYIGNWIPVMEWTRSNGQTVDANIVYTNTSKKVTSELITQLDLNEIGVTFTCKTTFKQTSTKIIRTRRPGETVATNIPHYQHLWNITLKVLYAPRNLSIVPKKSVYAVGDRLECSARGNPTPTYEWMETETNKTIHGSILTIDDYLMSDKSHGFRCTAYNTVAGSRRQIAETITVTAKEGSQIPAVQSIIISIIAVGTVCCLVLTLYLCNNRCPYKRGRARSEPDILQAVQINPYDIAESLEDYPTDRLRSVQAVHPPGVQGGNLQQQHPRPVYSEVRRKENNDDPYLANDGATGGGLLKHQGLPVYTEVPKNRNGSKNSDGPRQTAEATVAQYRLPPRTLTGADGTQYMDVTSIRDQNARAPIRHPPMFSVVETYASIDHTVGAPPPLPPKRQ